MEMIQQKLPGSGSLEYRVAVGDFVERNGALATLTVRNNGCKIFYFFIFCGLLPEATYDCFKHRCYLPIETKSQPPYDSM